MKIASIIFLLFACISCKQRNYVVDTSNNIAYKPNTAFLLYEDISLPRFDSLKVKYQLDTIFHGETDEFKRILLLRNWIRQKVSINDFGDPYPGGDHPQGIIDAAMKGQGFHCGHYMVVQNAIMNAYGYVTRCLGSGPGEKNGEDGHHGMNEIWVNKFHKWFLCDAKFNHHFEKNGIPLSALEIRDEYLKNKAADVMLMKGPDREPVELDSLRNEKGEMVYHDKTWFARWYTWLEWDKTSTRFTAWPAFNTKLNMYRDDYFRNHTWFWDGKPHWAYNTDDVTYQDSRDAIEWTPNVINASAVTSGDHAKVYLRSFTPNFKEYEINQNGSWSRCDSVVDFPLNKNEEHIAFRAVNIAGVAGPEYKINFVSK